MARTLPSDQGDGDRIVLNLLNSLEHDGTRSQRHLAAELGIALGLVNAYLKRCVKKGLVKVSEAPARRYAYYLTPHGFAEKSRLTVEYLSDSFSFFRRAKSDCAHIFEQAKSCNFHRLVLAGRSDLAEIAILSAVERGVSIVAVVDGAADSDLYVGMPLVTDFGNIAVPFDAVIVTNLRSPKTTFDNAANAVGAHCVLVPKLLGLSAPSKPEGTQ